jgi:DNA modification methylase
LFGVFAVAQQAHGVDDGGASFSLKTHFATFPEELPETCIKAATSEKGCCPEWGAPFKRILKPTEEYAK